MLVAARLIIGAVFALAGIGKLLTPPDERADAFAQWRVGPSALAPALSLLLPIVELFIAVALSLGAATQVALHLALLLLGAFLAVQVRQIVTHRVTTPQPCKCFGPFFSKSQTTWQATARNGFLFDLALMGLNQLHGSPSASPVLSPILWSTLITLLLSAALLIGEREWRRHSGGRPGGPPPSGDDSDMATAGIAID